MNKQPGRLCYIISQARRLSYIFSQARRLSYIIIKNIDPVRYYSLFYSIFRLGYPYSDDYILSVPF